MRSSENEFRGAGQRGAPDGEPERLVAYVVCINPQCGYSAGFADLRDSPSNCPACGGELLRECGTCHMILRSSSPMCTNCGRPIAQGHQASPEPTR